MNWKGNYFLFFLLLLTFKNFGQAVPEQKPNQISNGKKQGDWVIWQTARWEPTDILDSVVYYRKISFSNGSPVGLVTDYFRNGKPQWEGYLLAADPDIIEGKAIWYYSNGNKKEESNFKAGKKNGVEMSYFESGAVQSKAKYIDGKLDGEVIVYYKNGSPKSIGSFNMGIRVGKWVWYFENGKVDNEQNYSQSPEEKKWNSMQDVADKLKNEQKLNEAIEQTKKALKYAKDNFGKNHNNYLYSLEVLALLYQDLADFKTALPLFLEVREIVESWLGKATSHYAICLYNLAGLYEKMNDYQKSLPLYLEALETFEKTIGKNDSRYGDCLNNLAFLYQNMKQYDKALPTFLEALSNTEKTLGKEHKDYGVCLQNLANLYTEMGQYEKALPLLNWALENIKNNLGINSLSYAICLSDLANVYAKNGQTEKALPFFIEALQTVEKTEGKTSITYGNLLNNLAMLYMDLGKYPLALSSYQEALAIIEKFSGKTDPAYGNILNNIAVLYSHTGQYSKAVPILQESLSLIEKTKGKADDDYWSCVGNIAVLYMYLGWYDKALPMSENALKNTEKIFGKLHPSYGVALNNLAEIYYQMGLIENALPLFQESLSITEKSFGKDHSSCAISLNNLGNLFCLMERYEEALPLYQRALTITEKTLGKEHESYGIITNSLANLYQSMGQYEKAQNLFIDAIENARKAAHGGVPNNGSYLSNLAGLYVDAGANEAALPLYQEALKNIASHLGKEHPDYASAIGNLAILYSEMGRFDSALLLNQESLRITEIANGKEHHAYGKALSNLGVLYYEMGVYDKALSLLSEGSSIIEKTLGKDKTESDLNSMAAVYEEMGNYDSAYAAFEKANKITYKNIQHNFSFLSEKGKTEYVDKLLFHNDIFQSFCLKNIQKLPDVAGDAFNIELATKGMILNSGTEMRVSILRSGNEEAIKTYEAWNKLKVAIARQYSLPLSERSESLNETEEKANKLEEDLTRLSVSFKKEKSLLGIHWNDVQNAMKLNEVAIEFTTFHYHSHKSWSDSNIYVALVLRKNDKLPLLIPLCEEKQLDSLFKKNGASDATFVAGLYRGTELMDKAEISYGKRLYELVWKPLEKYLHNSDKIFFASSGLLHQIAFAAIPYKTDSLLSDKYKLNQVSSTSVICNPSSAIKGKPETMAVFGGIQYEASPKDVPSFDSKTTEKTQSVSRGIPANINRGATMAYLPGTLTEANSIVSVANENKIKVNSYYGLKASEETFKQLGNGNSPQVIHIATHGFFFPDPANQKSTSSTKDSKSVYADSDNPLNRSGLLFAGANNAWVGNPVPGIEDGILTAFEAANLSLDKTQLVVLSACETGLGDIKGSEGVFGLQRSFKMAGVEYLMMSLWQVPDAETSEFMKKFYGFWFAGNSISDSFIMTQNFMKSKYPKEPYKWAAFVLIK